MQSYKVMVLSCKRITAWLAARANPLWLDGCARMRWERLVSHGLLQQQRVALILPEHTKRVLACQHTLRILWRQNAASASEHDTFTANHKVMLPGDRQTAAATKCRLVEHAHTVS